MAHGETDLILTVLTEGEGKLGARLRGGRRSSHRAAGGIEPFHTLELSLEDRGGELLTLKETRIVKVRARLVADLEAMDAAGTALRWARHLLPVRHADARSWTTLVELLDALDAPESLAPRDASARAPGDPAGARSRGLLAMAGFRLLSSVGYALELARCVVCGRECPEGVPAFVQAGRGGVVCRSCGGAGRLLDGRARALADRAQRGDDDVAVADAASAARGWLRLPDWLTRAQADDLLAVLSDAMAAHTGLDPSR